MKVPEFGMKAGDFGKKIPELNKKHLKKAEERIG